MSNIFFSIREVLFEFRENYFLFDFVFLDKFRDILRLRLFPEKWFPGNYFLNFPCLFVIKKVGQRKTLSSQRKIWLGFQKSVFLEYLDGKHFPEVMKNLEMSYYLLIISNLVLKLLIAIYNLFWIFIFQFHL